jgi:hypothetical protein
LDYLFGCAHLFRAQQPEPISNTDLSLILLAPTITSALRRDAQVSHWTLDQEEDGIYRIQGPLFATWLIETDRRAGPGEPVLTLFSRVLLQNRRHIMDQLSAAGFQGLLYYTLQQIQQFRAAGEPFMIQNKDLEVMYEVEKDLRAAVLKAIPAEERLEGLSAEERLEGLSAEERLKGLLPDEVLRALGHAEIGVAWSNEQLVRLRELLDQKKRTADQPPSSESP